jgi:hypothetical protein
MKVVPFLCMATWLLRPVCVQGQSKAFSSVPYGSWPYTTYNRLVKLGYAQPIMKHEEFSSHPTLTRYEFAVATDRLVHGLSDKRQHITNRATISPLVDKLAKEFRPEINLLDHK